MIAMDLLDKNKGGHGGVIVNIASLAGEIKNIQVYLLIINVLDNTALSCVHSHGLLQEFCLMDFHLSTLRVNMGLLVSPEVLLR
jgi:hypothetical protein